MSNQPNPQPVQAPTPPAHHHQAAPVAPGQNPYSAPARTNTLALIAFVSSFFISLAGIICGHIAISQIRKTGEGGKGFAIAGLVIGYAALAISLLFFLLAITAVGVSYSV